MRFLVDESTGPMVAEWLRKNGHDVFSVFNESRGMPDADIIQKAFIDNRILVTNDKDFGEKVPAKRSSLVPSSFVLYIVLRSIHT